MHLRSIVLALFISALAISSPNCLAQVEAHLVSNREVIKPGTTFEMGLLLKHEASWHTYWKNSETGYPPTIKWDLPKGWTIKPQEWPTPEIYATDLGLDYIFKGETLLIYTVTAPESAPRGEENIRATAGWLMCKDICMPINNIELSLDISIGDTEEASPQASLFNKFHRKQAQVNPEWEIRAIEDQYNILLILIPTDKFFDPGHIYFFSESEGVALEPDQPQFRNENGNILLNILKKSDSTFTSIQGILKAERGWSASGSHSMLVDSVLHASAIHAIEAKQADNTSTITSLLRILLWAFIGGLILNLMPCVFPILGIKVMGFVSQAGSDKKKIKWHSLVFTLGVLISFWVLVSIFIFLKIAGENLGWGFQLQYPGTTYLMAAFILLFALNMSGVFEIGQSAIGVGSKLQHKSGYSGSFFSGVLATIVATPCSAPFLGTALGYAVTQTPVIMFLIFTFVALGLSSPYLLLSVFPNFVKILPKPGAWMESFKQFMAFLLYATVAYLIWILAKQVEPESMYGSYGLLKILLALIFIALAAWIYGRWATFDKPSKTKRIATLIALIIAIGALAYGYPKYVESSSKIPDSTIKPAYSGDSEFIHWEKWEPGKAEKLAEEGHIVWVDFTARWCVTCQTNKATVFGSKEVKNAFREMKVIALKADWTSRDPRITDALAKWNKAAVPFNLFYFPGKKVIEMPTILTSSSVLAALKNK